MHTGDLISSFRRELASHNCWEGRILKRIGKKVGGSKAMWLAYSSALPNKPSFWTGSPLANIWVFALKLFVCGGAIIILNRAKVWPWDGGILTSAVIFIEIGPFEDMKYRFSNLLVLILGSLYSCQDMLPHPYTASCCKLPQVFLLLSYHTHACMLVPLPPLTHSHMHARHTYTCAWKYAHTQTYAHTYTCSHAHMHTQVHIKYMLI